VTRQSLFEQTSVDGTPGYSGSYTVVVLSDSSRSSRSGGSSPSADSSGSGSSSEGTFTWLPVEGQVVRQGQQLYFGVELAGRAAVRFAARLPQPVGGCERA
jgi:hypothetical protein